MHHCCGCLSVLAILLPFTVFFCFNVTLSLSISVFFFVFVFSHFLCFFYAFCVLLVADENVLKSFCMRAFKNTQMNVIADCLLHYKTIKKKNIHTHETTTKHSIYENHRLYYIGCASRSKLQQKKIVTNFNIYRIVCKWKKDEKK